MQDIERVEEAIAWYERMLPWPNPHVEVLVKEARHSIEMRKVAERLAAEARRQETER